MSDDTALEMAQEFQALSTYLASTSEGGDALTRLVHLAIDVVPGCAWAAVTQNKRGQEPRSLAVSDSVANSVDQMQYAADEGPCLTAAAADGDDVISVADLEHETRWPAFCRSVLADSPVRSVLSVGLAGQPERTALNMYGKEAGAFTEDGVAAAALFTVHANMLLTQLDAQARTASLEAALSSSRTIGSAVGIIMTVHKITAEQAFEVLRKASQDLNIKVRDLAANVTLSGSVPPLSLLREDA